MMNSATYLNMPGAGIGPQSEQQKNGRQPIQHQVAQLLQQQETPQGWQSTVPIQLRLQIVLQLISSLRLIKPDMDITQHISIAINWENKVFINAADQPSYDQACRSKLIDIAQTRNRQAQNIQEHLRNPQPPPGNMMQPQMQGMPMSHNPPQFHFAANVNPQLQQPMQASGMPIPQPFMHQQPQLVMGNQQMGLQPIPPGLHPQIPPNHGQPQLTVEDNQMIQQIAHSLAVNTPRDQLDSIRHNLDNMHPDQRQFLAQQNIDPLMYFFRSHATRKLLEQKARMGQRAGHDLSVPANALMPQQPRPPSQNSPPIQSHPSHPSQIPPPQMVDPSFGGSMDQILVQQQDALRSQEAGQVVVPASQQRGNMRGTSQPQPNTLLGGGQMVPNLTQPLPVAAQYWGNPPLMPGNLQPSATQAPPHTASFGNMSTPAQLQGQLGGLSSQAGRVPQQNPNVPNLTKGAKETPPTQSRWHPQRVAQPNQSPDQNPVAVQHATPQPGAPAEIDANRQRQRQLNQHMASLTPDQRREFMKTFQRGPRPAPQVNPHVIESSGTLLAENQAGQQAPHQDVSSNTTTNNAEGVHDPALPPQPPLVAVPGPQQGLLQRAHPAARHNTQVAHLANTLTEEQAQQMDQLEFPKTILNSSGTLSHLPPNIKTWGQLKAWVSQQNNALPQGILGKIKLLQGLHYQNLAKQNNQVQQTPPNAGSNVQGVVIRPSAPTAPMVPARSNGQPFPAGNGPGIAQGPRATGGVPFPPPTIQEIQALRAQLPEHLHALTDEQIGLLIFKQRPGLMRPQGQPTMMSPQQVPNASRQRIYHPGMPSQQLAPSGNNPLVQPGNRSQHQQSSRPAGNPSKEQQVKQPSSNRNLPQTPSQGQPKGTKRSNNDDLIEAGNQPMTMQETHAHPAPAPAADRSKSNAQQATSEQSASAHASKQPLKANPSVSDPPSQLPPQASQSKAQSESEQIKFRINQLTTEIAPTMPVRQPISISAQTRAKMTQKLRDAKPSVCRIDNALPTFYKIFGDENAARELIRIRLLLVSQYQGPEFIPIEKLTVTPEELDMCLDKLNKYFQAIAKVLQQKASGAVPGPKMNQPSQGIPPTANKAQLPPETAPSLSAANLKEHQKAWQMQRQASVQRSHAAHGGNRAPAAPTSPQPPFHFGSPDGVPTKYANRTNELTQKQLRIPPTKKRKSEQPPGAASNLAQPQPSNAPKSPQLAKTATPLTQQMPSEAHPYKCHIPGCANQSKGFASQSDLEKHISDIHNPKEPKEPTIDDPLQWTLEQMRFGLGLDENGKSKSLPTDSKVDKHISETAKMKKTPSAQGQGAVKQESATPMTRVPTQTGPSPGSNLLKTPQASITMKTPGSEAKSTAKDAKAAESRTSQPSVTKQANTSSDPWATSLVSGAAISSAFSGLAGLTSTGTWSTIQHVMTPSSTLSSGVSDKTSPRVSDISENDAVKINLSSDPVDLFDWLTFDLTTPDDYPNDSDFESVERMDWDSSGLDGSTKEAKTEGPGERRAEDMEPSREWLKVFAPEALHRKRP